MALRYNDKLKTSNANGITAGNAVAGNTLDVNDNTRRKLEGLSALVVALAETNTLTFTAKWQVSNDGTTWVDVANGPQNAAGVVLATGTAGADTAVTKMFPAPDAVYGWRKVRLALVVGVATGAAADTYSIGYCYKPLSF